MNAAWKNYYWRRNFKETFINAAICQHGVSTGESPSAYGISQHSGMAARKTEHVAFNCWLVCVGGGIHSLTWPAMPKAVLRKVLSVYFFPGMQQSQLGKFIWLEQWMMGPEELQSPTLFFLSCFYSSYILIRLLVHSTKAEGLMAMLCLPLAGKQSAAKSFLNLQVQVHFEHCSQWFQARKDTTSE